MTIKEAQELVDRWIREYGVRYFSELTNMTVLALGTALSGQSDRRRPHSGARKEHREEDPARLPPSHPQQETIGIDSHYY